MAYIPQREWEIEETELTFTSDNGHFLYMKTPLSEASNIATLIASETHIDPARDKGYMIYKIGYVQSVANGRSISMLWGNEKKPSFDWLTVEPTKVTIDRDLHVVGNITASKEITAWVGGAVTSDVLANLTANAPLYKPTTSSVGIRYSSAQFEVNGASELQIKSGVLAPAAHTHLISQITGLQAELDGKASLDSNGKIHGTQLPALAITDTFTASSQSGMLALSNAEVGDICVRTDINKSFILRESPYSTLSNWQELLNPALPALSTVAISGSYLDLINRPTSLPASDVYSWAKAATINAGIGGNALTSGYLPYWDGSKLANSLTSQSTYETITNGVSYYKSASGLVNYAISLGSTGNSYGSVGYGVKFNPTGVADSYGVNDRVSIIEFFDGGFLFKTASTGMTGNNITWVTRAGINNLGAFNVTTLSGSGTRLVSATSDGTLGATSDIDVTSAKAQSFKLKNTSGDVVWSIELSGTDLIFKNSAGVSKGKLDQSGNFVAAGEVTAYGGI